MVITMSNTCQECYGTGGRTTYDSDPFTGEPIQERIDCGFCGGSGCMSDDEDEPENEDVERKNIFHSV